MPIHMETRVRTEFSPDFGDIFKTQISEIGPSNVLSIPFILEPVLQIQVGGQSNGILLGWGNSSYQDADQQDEEKDEMVFRMGTLQKASMTFTKAK